MFTLELAINIMSPLVISYVIRTDAFITASNFIAFNVSRLVNLPNVNLEDASGFRGIVANPAMELSCF